MSLYNRPHPNIAPPSCCLWRTLNEQDVGKQNEYYGPLPLSSALTDSIKLIARVDNKGREEYPMRLWCSKSNVTSRLAHVTEPRH